MRGSCRSGFSRDPQILQDARLLDTRTTLRNSSSSALRGHDPFSLYRTPSLRHREYSRCGATTRAPRFSASAGRESTAITAPSCTAPNVPRSIASTKNAHQAIDMNSLLLPLPMTARCTTQHSPNRPCRRSARCAAIAHRIDCSTRPPPRTPLRPPINLHSTAQRSTTFPPNGRLWPANGADSVARTVRESRLHLIYDSQPKPRSTPPVHRNICSLPTRPNPVRLLLSST